MSSEYHDPKNILPVKDYWENYIPSEDIVDTKSDGIFHIGQYENKNIAKTAYCKVCGGNNFNVGIEEYFTAIRCTTCHWEFCIHDG